MVASSVTSRPRGRRALTAIPGVIEGLMRSLHCDTPTDLARALGWPERTARYWATTGRMPLAAYLQARRAAKPRFKLFTDGRLAVIPTRTK